MCKTRCCAQELSSKSSEISPNAVGICVTSYVVLKQFIVLCIIDGIESLESIQSDSRMYFRTFEPLWKKTNQ